MLFDDLVRAQLPLDLLPAVDELVRIKKGTSELGTGPKIPELDRYIREQITLLEEEAGRAENRRNDWNQLEEFFQGSVSGAI